MKEDKKNKSQDQNNNLNKNDLENVAGGGPNGKDWLARENDSYDRLKKGNYKDFFS